MAWCMRSSAGEHAIAGGIGRVVPCRAGAILVGKWCGGFAVTLWSTHCMCVSNSSICCAFMTTAMLATAATRLLSRMHDLTCVLVVSSSVFKLISGWGEIVVSAYLAFHKLACVCYALARAWIFASMYHGQLLEKLHCTMQ